MTIVIKQKELNQTNEQLSILVNNIANKNEKWEIHCKSSEEFNTKLIQFARKADISSIISKLEYQSSLEWPYSIFNTVGQYAVLTKIAENAYEDEKAGKQEQADWQWKAILAILNPKKIKKEAINYCSFIKGWNTENKEGEPQNDRL
ncbi:hypothetical protein [Rickettsia endosymbiont of Halotydeus destructor]|uniref:hypothetical protein n=1 Tax=Rickettsia endosymbiont of Halotydeus destructor TaxID=2996754 RepID=UPI003BAED05C